MVKHNLAEYMVYRTDLNAIVCFHTHEDEAKDYCRRYTAAALRNGMACEFKYRRLTLDELNRLSKVIKE